MNKSKRTIIIIGCIVTVMIITATVALGHSISNRKGKDQEVQVTPEVSQTPEESEMPDTSQEEVQEVQVTPQTVTEREYTYLNIDGLYFSPSWENYIFQDALEEYLEEIGLADISVVEIVPKIETEDEIIYNFWLLLDADVAMIKGTHDSDSVEYSFEIETDESIIGKYIDLNSPDGIDDPDTSYDDSIEIYNLDELDGVLPDGAYNRFVSELMSYLASEREMRSYYYLSDISVNGSTVTFMCNFETPRRDNKNISVTYSAETDSFSFTLV